MATTSCPGRPTLTVGKIVAVGRNYADHAKEMGAPVPAEPVLFLKPPTALQVGDGDLTLPSFSRDVHHEVELVLRIGRGGRNLDLDAAAQAVDAFAVGIDVTARDLQADAKRRGEPWAVAKGFDGSAPLGPLVPFGPPETPAAGDLLGRLELELTVNGARRQRGATGDLLFPVTTLVAFISSRFRLEPGDLVFTGTPAGVGPLRDGDAVVATLRELHAGSPRELSRLRLQVRGA